MASRGMKTYSESRIELRNLKMLKKIAGKINSVFVIRAALWAEKSDFTCLRATLFETGSHFVFLRLLGGE